MCIVFLGLKAHPRYPLVVLANRDEFLARPTQPMHAWEGLPQILAGKDLVGGGTWFGVSGYGELALLTNYREPTEATTDQPSRGLLVTTFLRHEHLDFAAYLRENGQRYAGFNLVFGPFDSLTHYSNRSGAFTPMEEGVHGLSNALLDTPWPKVQRGKAELSICLEQPSLDPGRLLAILNDASPAKDDELPNTGLPVALEQRLSSIRIPSSNGYASRSATLLLVDTNGVAHLWEKPYDGGRTLSFELPIRTR